MKYVTLGHTGLLVSKLCFGTMTFGDGRGLFKALSAVSQAEADELVKMSIDGGINFFDTADNYTEGESERILGQSLKNLNIARKDVVIATKVYSRVGSGRNDVGASRGHIMDGVEDSLRRLQTDHIDSDVRIPSDSNHTSAFALEAMVWSWIAERPPVPIRPKPLILPSRPTSSYRDRKG
jgi:aryl-alcohol dehydrogenase-like predicted oxidoreductase